jgi:histidine phosphotransferase ChpT
MASSTDLAALLCSRLCHDMLSPVGALSNGLELLAEEKDPEMRKRCFELLEQSAHISTSKLKFFRLAYGAAGGFGDQVPSEEPHELISGLVQGNGRITLEWAVSEPTLPKPAVKVLLNLASIAIDALIRGGTLLIGAEQRDGATEIAVHASGQRVAFDANIGKALDGSLDLDELSGRTAPAHLIRLLAQELGGGLQYALNGEALVMGAVLPDNRR